MRKYRYDIEIGASNTIKKKADTLRGIYRALAGCYGRCSVVDTKTNREIYFGTVDEVRQAISERLPDVASIYLPYNC